MKTDKMLEVSLFGSDLEIDDLLTKGELNSRKDMFKSYGIRNFYRDNPFVLFSVGGNTPYVFPSHITEGKNETIQIKEEFPIFEGNARIVTGQTKEKREIYFLGKGETIPIGERKITLSAVCVPFAFEVNPEDSDIRNKLVYNGDFNLKRVLKRVGQYLMLEVDEINTELNGINFVANSQNIRSRKGKRLQQKFYLFGIQTV